MKSRRQRPVVQQVKDIDLWKEEVRESRDQCGWSWQDSESMWDISGVKSSRE